VFKVTLASGRTLRATELHQLLGATGWVRVRDLQIGDRVAIARRLPEPEETEEWPEERVALLGQLIGDGSFLSNAPLRYTTGSEENSRLVKEAAEGEFRAKVTRYAGRGNWHQLVISGNGNRWHPAGVNLWLRELGIFGQRSHQKRLPDQVFRLSNKQIALLLRHLWATDGCIFVRRPGVRGSARVYFSTSSRGLACDVSALLLRIGIVARIRTVRQRDYRPWFEVVISGGYEQRRFLTVVDAFGPRRANANQLIRVLSSRRPSTNVDTLRQEVFVQVQAIMAERGVTQRQISSIRGTAYAGKAHYAFAPSRNHLAEYAKLLDSEILRTYATNDLFWDRIKSIAPDGEEEVFDLTVPGPSSWLADGIVSHNSGAIEQDSDIVMFIHRDDSDDPQVKGKADVIVAKHRNGPTATIPLTFLPHLTQFRNFARGV